jgi:hypothetical protein
MENFQPKTFSVFHNMNTYPDESRVCEEMHRLQRLAFLATFLYVLEQMEEDGLQGLVEQIETNQYHHQFFPVPTFPLPYRTSIQAFV